jgi:rhamnulokinase
LTVHAGPIEGAIIGNILVQAIADGTFKNLTEAREMVRKSFDIKTYLPQKE